MTDALYVIAKAPRVGFAKTRLGESIGHARAVVLYCAFLRDLAARFHNAPWRFGWYVTPVDAWPEMRRLVCPAGAEPTVLFQPSGDLTYRQRWLLEGGPARGEDRVVLIASDSPHVECGTIERAFMALDTHDAVFGPTQDGGYYLIGMRGWHDVLLKTPMGSSTVLQQLLANASRQGIRAATVETLFDVDIEADLPLLRDLVPQRDDLRHTGAALRAIDEACRKSGRPAPATSNLRTSA